MPESKHNAPTQSTSGYIFLRCCSGYIRTIPNLLRLLQQSYQFKTPTAPPSIIRWRFLCKCIMFTLPPCAEIDEPTCQWRPSGAGPTPRRWWSSCTRKTTVAAGPCCPEVLNFQAAAQLPIILEKISLQDCKVQGATQSCRP